MKPLLWALGGLALLGGGIVAVKVYGKDDDRFDDLFSAQEKRTGVPARWLKAICWNESSLGRYPSVAYGLEHPTEIEKSLSQDRLSIGIMQISIPSEKVRDHWSKWNATLADYGRTVKAKPALLNDPEFSVKLAAEILKEIRTRYFSSDPRFEEWSIKSYNQGLVNTNREKSGQIEGYADQYWERFQRNLSKSNVRKDG